MNPSAQQVCVGWLTSLALGAPAAVGLSGDPAVWLATGFITASGPVGGEPGIHLPVRRPVMQIDCWSHRPNSGDQLTPLCDRLAEAIIERTFGDTKLRPVPLPPGYRPVAVLQVWALSEPRRVGNDDAGLARTMFDLQMVWGWA